MTRRKVVSATHSAGRFHGRGVWIAAAVLFAATLAVFWPALGHDFVSFDDDVYVTDNPEVQKGLTADSIRWAWVTHHAANWHPLTWMSHMLDVELFGLDPAGHHATNLLLHAACAALLCLVLVRATGAFWPSVLAAALFAVHPLHVESVAWVAERKDVLSTVFLMLTLLAWLRYVKKASPGRYLLAGALLATGLCAKPMLVTVPVLLLLLDFWPLERITAGPGGKMDSRATWRLVKEKLPLVPLVAASTIVTLQAQEAGGAVRTLSEYSFGVRAANAVVSCLAYLGQAAWPVDLAVFYPHPGTALPAWKVLGSAAVLSIVTVGAFRARRRRPYLWVGWLWYVVTLLPVIGLVQVGEQAMADRYTYVPLIGIFIMVCWGAADLARALLGPTKRSGRLLLGRSAIIALAIVTLGALTVRTRMQLGYWQNSVTLFQHALEATGRNALAHLHLGLVLEEQGRIPEAIEHYERTIRDDVGYAALAHNNLGLLAVNDGRIEEAIEHYQQALHLDPSNASAHNNLGLALQELGRPEEALEQYAQALRADPRLASAHNNLGRTLLSLGRRTEAEQHLREAIRIDASDKRAYNNLGQALADQGRFDEAVLQYDEALRLDPGYAAAHNNLGLALDRLGRLEEAMRQYAAALQADPRYVQAHNNLARALSSVGRLDEAVEHLQAAVRLDPDYALAHYNLATALFLKDDCAAARSELQLARDLDFQPPQSFVDRLRDCPDSR